MSAIEAVAEAISSAPWGGRNPTPDEWEGMARAAVAALAAQGDITDDQIADAIEGAHMLHHANPFLNVEEAHKRFMLPAVRALIEQDRARQAAVHATREAEADAPLERLYALVHTPGRVDDLGAMLDSYIGDRGFMESYVRAQIESGREGTARAVGAEARIAELEAQIEEGWARTAKPARSLNCDEKHCGPVQEERAMRKAAEAEVRALDATVERDEAHIATLEEHLATLGYRPPPRPRAALADPTEGGA